MNKAYKVVWSAKRQGYAVCSEISSGVKPRQKSVVTLVASVLSVLGLAASVAMTLEAMAYEVSTKDFTTTDGHDKYATNTTISTNDY